MNELNANTLIANRQSAPDFNEEEPKNYKFSLVFEVGVEYEAHNHHDASEIMHKISGAILKDLQKVCPDIQYKDDISDFHVSN